MCGFFITNDPNISDGQLTAINSRLSFRGPDYQSAIVRHKGWSVYHARLSIIATDEKFSQPYLTKNGGVLVFNGEILNYCELAKTYNISDAVSDTQVLAELLERDLFDLNELEGFFAFVLINKSGELINCVRDRFGVKPLVYYKFKDYIAISSEASILSDIYSLPYSNVALDEYRVFRSPIFSESYFQGVASVLPGSCLIGGEYFNSLSFIPEVYGSLEVLIPELKHCISESIDSRLVADVPVGLLYSGGIDSNLIKHSTDVEFKCFTGGFSGDYDLEFAKSAASSNSNFTVINNESFLTRLEQMIALRKEPLSVPNEVVLSFIAESWREQGGRVLLSGEAADELFAGYERIYGWALNTTKFDVDTFLSFYAYAPVENINKDIKDRLNDFFSSLDGLSPFEKVRQFFVKKHLPVLFRRLDFALMFAGIEGREPLASTEMYKLALKFDPSDLFSRSLGKFPLRSIVSGLINDEFAFRQKVGFPIDIKNIIFNNKSKDRFENYSVWCDSNLERIL
tara:strand:+ start:123 stop:1661 length:1539 start_codon:yes stop_codon:yes gene_type:complete